jgi:hypothetical protein
LIVAHGNERLKKHIVVEESTEYMEKTIKEREFCVSGARGARPNIALVVRESPSRAISCLRI